LWSGALTEQSNLQKTCSLYREGTLVQSIDLKKYVRSFVNMDPKVLGLVRLKAAIPAHLDHSHFFVDTTQGQVYDEISARSYKTEFFSA
jgi:hypothetical protein